MSEFTIQPLRNEDRDWLAKTLQEAWGSVFAVRKGEAVDASALPGFVARQAGEAVGLVTYQITGDSCEVVTLDSFVPKVGVGSALIAAVKEEARAAGCRRLWLITTNDNMNALGFYQKRGFVLVALHRNALEASRRLKPEIPLIGYDGIPLRDEIELEMTW